MSSQDLAQNAPGEGLSRGEAPAKSVIPCAFMT